MVAFLKRNQHIFLLFVSLMMLASHLGLIQTNIMEARNLITAREMVNDGHWIFTTMNGLPRYEKPPLPTWITALMMMAAGMQNMFLLRIPVVIITLILVYYFFRLATLMQLNNHQPLNASLILITSFYIFFGGRDNQWDMYTHAFMIGCIYYLYKIFTEQKAGAKNIVLSGLFFGCSFLSKGPVSLYVLFLSFLIAYLSVYRNNVGVKLKWSLLVALIGLVIGLSWPVYVRFFDTAHVHAAVSKETNNWGSYDTKPFWHYWSFVTQSGLWTVPSFMALMYFYMRRRVTNIKAYTFSFWWTIISVLLLSFIPEKKMRYLLPVLIPMALNTSFYIQYLFYNFSSVKNRLEKGWVNFTFGLVGIIALLAPLAALLLFKQRIVAYLGWYILFFISSLTAGVIMIRSLNKKQFENFFYTSIIFMCCIVFTVIPLSKIFYNNTAYYSAANLHNFEKKFNIRSYETKDFTPELIWDYGNPLPEIENGDNIKMPSDKSFGLLIFPEEINSITSRFKNYSFSKLASVDINAMNKEQGGYSRRLQKDYYLVKKLN